ncbi:MAG: hypothetical protein U0401_23530 [Anaerolineae bacterium]
MQPNHQRTPEEIQQDFHRELEQILHPGQGKADKTKLDWRRFRKVRWFFAKAFIQVIFWDIVLNRPVLRWLRTPPLPRWQKIARNFRLLAVEMGGTG